MIDLMSLFKRPDDQLMSNDYGIPQAPMIGSANDMGRISDVMGAPHQQMMGQDPQGFNPSDIYMKHLASLYDTMPDKNNFQPSPMRSFGSKLAALGAMGPATYHDGMALGLDYNPEVQAKIKDAFEYGPYNDAMQKFGIQAKGYTDLAKLEESGNQNKRIEYDQAEANRVRQQNADTAAQRARDLNENADASLVAKIKDAEAKNAQKEKEIQIKRDRADSYIAAQQFKQDNPDWKTVVDENTDELMFWNPKTREVQASGLKGASEQEKSKLKVEGNLREIAARSAAAQSLEGTKNTNRLGQIAATGANAVTTKQTLSGNKPTSSTNETRARKERADKFKADNPKLAQWIITDNTGVHITPPSTGGYLSSGPSQKDYDAMKGMIFGTTVTMPNAQKADPLGIR